MAKKKKTTKTQQKAFSPEHYLRDKMRKNPMYKCYITSDWQETGNSSILIIRQHPYGKYSLGFFLVDTWCRGLVDCFYKISVDEDQMTTYLERYLDNATVPSQETDYPLVHNIIYGAIEYAGEAGLFPPKEWAYGQYMLEEDTDDVPYIDIEFGRNGKYLLCVKDPIEYDRCRKILDRTLGPGNYDYISPSHSNEEEDSVSEGLQWGLDVGYEYEHPDYPGPEALEKLSYPDLVDVLQQEIDQIPPEKIQDILARPASKLADDLELILLTEIGAAWPLIADSQEDMIEHKYPLVSNVLLLLGAVGDESRLDTVFELLRQSGSFVDFYFGDWLEDYMAPVIYRLAKDAPERVYQFMIEPGLAIFNRAAVITTYVRMVAKLQPERRDELVELVRRLLQYYLAHQNDPLIWNGEVLGLMMECLEILAAKELEPEVRALYATGKMEESINGPLSEALESIENATGEIKDVPPLDIFAWRDAYIRQLQAIQARKSPATE